MKTLICTLLLLLVPTYVYSQEPPIFIQNYPKVTAQELEWCGTWKVLNKAGTVGLWLTLDRNGNVKKSDDLTMVGLYSYTEDGVKIIWSNGDTSLLIKNRDGTYVKKNYGLGKDLKGEPDNVKRITK
jgi:hypothetical protein